jgi:hypothetical protein
MDTRELNDTYGSVELEYRRHDASANCTLVEDYVSKLQDEPDFVNAPPHYTNGSIECIDYIKDALTEEEYRGYLRGCMIKYQHRLMHKGNPKQNAEKMGWYNNKLVEVL